MPYASGPVCSCWSQNVEQVDGGGSASDGPVDESAPAPAGVVMLAGVRNAPSFVTPTTPATRLAIDDGTDSDLLGACMT